MKSHIAQSFTNGGAGIAAGEMRSDALDETTRQIEQEGKFA